MIFSPSKVTFNFASLASDRIPGASNGGQAFQFGAVSQKQAVGGATAFQFGGIDAGGDPAATYTITREPPTDVFHFGANVVVEV